MIIKDHKLLGKKTLTKVFPGLVSNIGSNLASNVINKFERRLSRKGAVRAGKEFTLFISN